MYVVFQAPEVNSYLKKNSSILCIKAPLGAALLLIMRKNSNWTTNDDE